MKKTLIPLLSFVLVALLAMSVLQRDVHAEDALPEGAIAWVDKNANGTYEAATDGYGTTIQTALAAIDGDGQTLYALADRSGTMSASQCTINYSCTLELNGHTWSAKNYLLVIAAKKTVTVRNGNINGSYNNTVGNHTISVLPGASLTLDNVKLRNGQANSSVGKAAIVAGKSGTTGTVNITLKDSLVYSEGGTTQSFAIAAIYENTTVNLSMENSHAQATGDKYTLYAVNKSTLQVTMDAKSTLSSLNDLLYNSNTDITVPENCQIVKSQNGETEVLSVQPKVYTVFWMIDDETVYAQTSVQSGQAITAPEEDPVRAGYTFTGWEAYPETMPGQDITVRATWQESQLASYTVNAQAGEGGSASFAGASSVSVTEGQEATLTVTTREGWYVASVTVDGTTLEAPRDGGEISWTPARDQEVAVVTFAQYPLYFESADKQTTQYCIGIAEAVALVTDESDTIRLMTDMALNGTNQVGNNYRIDVTVGFILDLDGNVLTSDRGILRFMYQELETEATMTIRNGILVAAENAAAQHMINLQNHGNLVLDNVKAYCGAYYRNGQIVANQTEVDASKDGVGAVIMNQGGGNVTVTDSHLQTFGKYHVYISYNVNEALPMAEVTLENSTLMVSGDKKAVFGSADSRQYTVRFLDEKSQLYTPLATNGAAHVNAQLVPYTGYALVRSAKQETIDGVAYWRFAQNPTYIITWINYDGTVLQTQEVLIGETPKYAGMLPAHENPRYVFNGWDAELFPVSGPATYQATYTELPETYQTATLDLQQETQLYKTQGRVYVTEDGLNMDFAGSSFEFTAQIGGSITVHYSSEEDVYFQLVVDGAFSDRVLLPQGKNMSVVLTQGLPAGEHIIRVVRDTDIDRYGALFAVSSLSFTGQKETVAATPERELVFEFIGDSITAGRSSATEYADELATHKFTNSYAYLISEALGADYTVVARGGCGYFNTVGSCQLPAYEIYPYYNGFRNEAERVVYTPTRKADVVFLALGTNDNDQEDLVAIAQERGLPYTTFEEAVSYQVALIRQMHGENVKIVLLYNMMNSRWHTEMQNAAQQEGLYILKVTQNRDGGTNHPSAQGHAVIAQEIVDYLDSCSILASAMIGDTVYSDLQAAVDAAEPGQIVKLNRNVTQNIVIAGDVTLDLNGYTLTGNVTGEGTLYVKDSSGDDYQLPNGRIVGSVTNLAQVTDGQYLAIAEETGYSFHRFCLRVTHMSIRPATTGVGYKAMFQADEAVLALVEHFGYTLQLGEHTPVTKTTDKVTSGAAVTLRIDNYDVVNYGQTDLAAKVFIALKDGTVLESTTVSYSMRDILEAINDAIATLSAQQITAAQQMCAPFADAIRDWAITDLMNWKATEE